MREDQLNVDNIHNLSVMKTRYTIQHDTSHFRKSYAIHQEVQTSFSLRSSYLSFGSILLQIDAVASAVSNDSPVQMQNQCATSRGNRRCREQHGEKHVVPNRMTSKDIFSCEDTSSETEIPSFVK